MPLASSKGQQQVGATNSHEVQPLFCVPQKTSHLTGLIWGPALVPADCCKHVRDFLGPRAMVMPQRLLALLRQGPLAALAPGPRV